MRLVGMLGCGVSARAESLTKRVGASFFLGQRGLFWCQLQQEFGGHRQVRQSSVGPVKRSRGWMGRAGECWRGLCVTGRLLVCST